MTGEFRCFSCANPVCALAGRVPSIIPCDMVCKRGECLDGSIVLKKHDTGFVLSCDKYPCRNQFKSLWLPKMIKNAVTKPEHPCRSCSIALNWPMAKVHLQLNMQLVPPGVMGIGILLVVWCVCVAVDFGKRWDWHNHHLGCCSPMPTVVEMVLVVVLLQITSN